MAEPTSPSTAASTSKTTPAQRIAELNEIDKSVSVLLDAAAEAIATLANKRDDSVPFATLEGQQGRLEKAADNYYSTLSSIEVRLRRQVYALEEAGLIKEGVEPKGKGKRTKVAELGFESTVGGGPLDPSWLNARADKGIEHKLQKEILHQAKDFLESKKGSKDGDATG